MDNFVAYRTPLGLAGTGIIFIIVGMVLQALVPPLSAVGGFIIGVGWVIIVVAVLFFLIGMVRGTFK